MKSLEDYSIYEEKKFKIDWIWENLSKAKIIAQKRGFNGKDFWLDCDTWGEDHINKKFREMNEWGGWYYRWYKGEYEVRCAQSRIAGYDSASAASGLSARHCSNCSRNKPNFGKPCCRIM